MPLSQPESFAAINKTRIKKKTFNAFWLIGTFINTKISITRAKTKISIVSMANDFD